ncbi:MAG: CCA tRNA nucleotidyltransferase [Methylobacterium mesophilicum]|nr:CCA tRNA nucleotidyltransferase [Methylobacterium mesophilicum]
MTRIDPAYAPWLADESLQRLLAVLGADGEEARVAGGAVRNALLGEPISDVDVATTNMPDATMRRAREAGFKPVPTGFDHGTVTVVVGERPFEVTTLRADIEADGRHAVVRFGRDWQTDADRRDLTINALYCDAGGEVLDLVGGLADIESRTVRFIGDPETRIREDALRILRFFRFFASYGKGRPDAEGLKACARLKELVDTLSAERVWSELRKLLGAPDPSRALLWMRQSGVLSRVLPESEKWGIDAIHGLVAAEGALDWRADSLLRLESIVPPDAARMEGLARRLKLSKAEGARLRHWAMAEPVSPALADLALRQRIYRGDRQGILDRLRLAIAGLRQQAESDAAKLADLAALTRLEAITRDWPTPRFPLGGKDLAGLGYEAGPKLGKELARLEEEWMQSGFALSAETLLSRVRPAEA